MTDLSKFPKDAPRQLVLAALKRLEFAIVRTGNHIALRCLNEDGTETPMTIPNHKHIKGSTLRRICTQGRIGRETFLKAYYDSD